MPQFKCYVCEKVTETLLTCSKCKLVDYCSKECQLQDWNDGHKVFCSTVPKTITKSKPKIDNFDIQKYNIGYVGPFMSSEAQAERGEIVEEEAAQDTCYDAMECESGSYTKLKVILSALKQFPLSTEGWGMLGSFYREFQMKHPNHSDLCFQTSLEMNDIAIRCARLLNPSWTADRRSTLEWGLMYTRPYLRAICNRALALKGLGRTEEATQQAKKLLKWNPRDNQGIRKLLCNWFLELGDTEGALNLFRSFQTSGDAFLAYTDVLLQFLRWKKDDIFEDDVQKTLVKALKANPYVPAILLSDNFTEVHHAYISPGEQDEAQSYANDGYHLWKKHSDALQWLRTSQFVNGQKVPAEQDLIKLLRSKGDLLMKCTHTNRNCQDRTTSTLKVTQTRNFCVGCGLDSFEWPSHLDEPHKNSDNIWIHNNEFKVTDNWRITQYNEVIEVPFWHIFLELADEIDDE